MKRAFVVAIAILIIIIVLFASFLVTKLDFSNTKTTQAYVGVAYCGNTIADGKMLIDKVKG